MKNITILSELAIAKGFRFISFKNFNHVRNLREQNFEFLNFTYFGAINAVADYTFLSQAMKKILIKFLLFFFIRSQLSRKIIDDKKGKNK